MNADAVPAPPSGATSPADYHALAGARELPGRRIVVIMVLFAAGMIGLLFLYWELYTRPFRPLQAAIAAEFPGSSPRAVGGKPKSHLPQSPSILRLIVRIPWDPREEEARARQTANRLMEICRAHVPLNDYERMEIVLMHRRPEQWTVSWWCEAPVAAFPLTVDGVLPETIEIRTVEGVEGS